MRIDQGIVTHFCIIDAKSARSFPQHTNIEKFLLNGKSV